MCASIVILLAFLAGILTAQTTFTVKYFEEQALVYTPHQRPGVTDKSFSFGKMVLRETSRQTNNDLKAFSRADYFNVLAGLILLQESEANIRLAWQKFTASEGSCEYLISTDFKASFLKEKTPDYIKRAWAEEEANCHSGGFVANTHNLNQKRTPLKTIWTLRC